MALFDNKTIVVTGGTGSLGKVLVKRLLSGSAGTPKKIIIFSRDEAKQHFMRMEYQQKKTVTDEVIYNNFDYLVLDDVGFPNITRIFKQILNEKLMQICLL